MLFLKAISLNYTDTNASNYKVAKQVDVANLAGDTSFNWLRGNADPDYPQFDDRGDWYEIFPTPTSAHNVSQMIRIFYYLKPTQYAATSDTVAYPENLDQAILGWRIASSYLYSLGDPDKLLQAEKFNAKYEERVRQYIATLSRGSQQPLTATPVQISGWEF